MVVAAKAIQRLAQPVEANSPQKGRKPSPFKQSDITRATKGVLKAGVDVGLVEVAPAGQIRIFAKDMSEAVAESALDGWRNEGNG